MGRAAKRTVGRKVERRRWKLSQSKGRCVVSGYVETTGLWQTLAKISGETITLEEIARLVELVNSRQGNADLLRSAFRALKEIEEDGYTYSTEGELEDVIERLEKQKLRSV